MTARKKVIIDTDAGTDDAIAILMATEAARYDEVEILGITCVYGNTTLDNVVQNVLRILRTVNRSDIPVFKGASSPLVEKMFRSSAPYHGHDGFGDYPWNDAGSLDTSSVSEEHAANALIRLAHEHPGEISLILLGPLTNMALAMKMDPTLTTKFKEISIMGGNTKAFGNIHIAKEFNFFSDPDAAFVVLDNMDSPAYIIPWELCMEQVHTPYKWRVETLGSIASPESDLMNKAEQGIVDKKMHANWIMCDPVAVAIVLDSTCAVQTQMHYVTVERHGELTKGTMLLDHMGHLKQKPNAHVVCQVDMEKIKTRFSWAFGAPRS